jgi:hypothetical protein
MMLLTDVHRNIGAFQVLQLIADIVESSWLVLQESSFRVPAWVILDRLQDRNVHERLPSCITTVNLSVQILGEASRLVDLDVRKLRVESSNDVIAGSRSCTIC